jgi:hypothetical protein
LKATKTVNLFIDTLSSTLDGRVSLSDTTHTATILDNENRRDQLPRRPVER